MEKAIYEKGFNLLQKADSKRAGYDYWKNKILEWSMSDLNFKTSLFRFIDVLPVLNDSKSIVSHLQEYFENNLSKTEMPLGLGLMTSFLGSIGKANWSASLFAKIIRSNANEMAKTFIIGSNPENALPVLEKLRQNNIAFTVDLLGEASVNEEEALIEQEKYLNLIYSLQEKTVNWSQNSLLDSNHLESIPKINVSVKLSSLYSQINITDFEGSLKELKKRLLPILKAAHKTNTFINLDMEQFALKDLTYAVFMGCLEEDELKDFKNAGIVVQAYLKSAEYDLLKLIEWCEKYNRQITVRLVKGAYWDYEVVHAKQQNWPIPVFMHKESTDANYEKLTRLMLENSEYILPAFGSHNIRSLAHAFVLAEQMGLPKNLLEVQMLYGMAEPIKKVLSELNYRLRDYAPIGELIPGMAYFVRRLLENTSNESFLQLKYFGNVSAEQLLKKPNFIEEKLLDKKEFSNEAPLDFRIEENRLKYQRTLTEIESKLPIKVSPIINGQKIENSARSFSVNPCKPSQIIAENICANLQNAQKALEICAGSLKKWQNTSIEERADVLFKAVQIMHKKKFELCAWETLEVGKTWKEADGDICEAIDFCNYYAQEALQLAKGKTLHKVPGEDNKYLYRPKGVGVVIAPWNFPLAIPMGMVTASLVMGNTIIFKPAAQAVKMGEWLYNILFEAGCPKEVLQFLPGEGAEIGPFLCNAPETAFIAFTGSMEIGTQIIEGTAKRFEGMHLVKKTIAEMGGKNALIIDADADLDEAIIGTLYSAFGYQGQKCSALSRLLVHEKIYDRFMHRLREAILNLKVGPASNPENYLAAVIDEKAYKRLLKIIEETKKIAGKFTQAQFKATEGYFVPPTLFEELPLDSQAATQELFGPIVSAFKFSSIEEAVQLANQLSFALTGGLYSRSPKNIAFIKNNLEAGNIYINRSITGAIVGRHPFGGYKLSGIGSKAGGPDYLLQFTDPITIVENTMRKGFSPDI